MAAPIFATTGRPAAAVVVAPAPAPAPRRAISGSRGRRPEEGLEAARPLSRSRSAHPGRKRLVRWLNDHFIHARAFLWGGARTARGGAASVAASGGVDSSAGVSVPLTAEEELAEVLAHVVLEVPHRHVYADLRTADADLMKAFRRGLIGAEHLAAARPSHATAARRGVAAAAKASARTVLQSLYNRIDRRIRPVLLREGRIAVTALRGGPASTSGSSGDADHLLAAHVGASWLVDVEVLVQRLIDGTLADDAPFIAEARARVAAGEEGVRSRSGAVHAYGYSDAFVRSLGGGVVVGAGPRHKRGGWAQRSAFVPLTASLHRILASGVAAFYGCGVQMLEQAPAGMTMVAGAKVVRITSPELVPDDGGMLVVGGVPAGAGASASAAVRREGKGRVARDGAGGPSGDAGRGGGSDTDTGSEDGEGERATGGDGDDGGEAVEVHPCGVAHVLRVRLGGEYEGTDARMPSPEPRPVGSPAGVREGVVGLHALAGATALPPHPIAASAPLAPPPIAPAASVAVGDGSGGGRAAVGAGGGVRVQQTRRRDVPHIPLFLLAVKVVTAAGEG